jgi:hypothetical protein
MRKTHKRIFIVLLVILGSMLPWLFYTILDSWSYTRDRRLVNDTQPCKIFVNPDKRFTLALYSKPSFIGILDVVKMFLMPMRASASDYPGVIILTDANGSILNSCEVELMMLVEKVIWESDYVSVPLVLEWKLPSETSAGQATVEKQDGAKRR